MSSIYPIVKVTWVDSIGSNGQWEAMQEVLDAFRKPKFTTQHESIGYLMVDGDTEKLIVPHVHEGLEDLGGEDQVTGYISIPTGCIKDIEYLGCLGEIEVEPTTPLKEALKGWSPTQILEDFAGPAPDTSEGEGKDSFTRSISETFAADHEDKAAADHEKLNPAYSAVKNEERLKEQQEEIHRLNALVQDLYEKIEQAETTLSDSQQEVMACLSEKKAAEDYAQSQCSMVKMVEGQLNLCGSTLKRLMDKVGTLNRSMSKRTTVTEQHYGQLIDALHQSDEWNEALTTVQSMMTRNILKDIE